MCCLLRTMEGLSPPVAISSFSESWHVVPGVINLDGWVVSILDIPRSFRFEGSQLEPAKPPGGGTHEAT
jgi:hypothetical protein